MGQIVYGKHAKAAMDSGALGQTDGVPLVQHDSKDNEQLPSHQPSISVLVPIYNTENYLEQALRSLRDQTFRDIEVICINDGSTDGSRAIIQKFLDTDHRFRVIDKPNSGYGASMNMGISAAHGRYIAILEPDDFFEPDALLKLIRLADQVNADVVKANYWFYWSKPRPKDEQINVITREMSGHVFSAAQEPNIFFANPSVWSAIYKRSFLLGNGIKLLETPGASFQDLGFTFKVFALAQRVFCIEDPILHYRQDNEQSSVNNPSKVFCVCDEFDSIEDFIDAAPVRASLRPYMFRLRYDSYMWNFERLTPQLRAEFVDTMAGDLRRGMQAGDYIPDLFAPYQQINLSYIIEDPQGFLEDYPTKPTRANKAMYYYRIGGLSTVRSTLRK